MVVTGGPRVGDLEATGVAALAGAQLSVISGGLLCVLGLIGVAWWFPELARYDAHVAAAEAEADASGGGSDAEAAQIPA